METKDNKDFIYDLMFFDWVLDENDTPHQLAELGTTFCTDTETNLLMTEKLKPVPLSEEILKKIGFRVGFMAKSEKAFALDIGNETHVLLRPTIGLFSQVDANEHKGTCGHCDKLHGQVYSVHELQHKLRVCGLKDLANGIKV